VRDSVVLETRPGRIEAVILAPRGWSPGSGEGDAVVAAFRDELDPLVKKANASLGINQRLAGWRLWPDEDFPRTHTLKVKRDQVRDWVGSEMAGPEEGVKRASGSRALDEVAAR